MYLDSKRPRSCGAFYYMGKGTLILDFNLE